MGPACTWALAALRMVVVFFPSELGWVSYILGSIPLGSCQQHEAMIWGQSSSLVFTSPANLLNFPSQEPLKLMDTVDVFPCVGQHRK